MAVNETHELAAGRLSAPGQGTVLATFTVTLFVSALLLFGIQPMFAKMVLPTLGGSAAVWSIALVFFQAVLLLGYAYAHLLTSRLPSRTTVLAHLAVFACATFFLPIAFPAGWEEVPQTGLSFWLIGLFAAGVGFPFFAISASAPLLQYWFSRTGHPHSSDPYFLYGASNVGSFAALLCYPFVIEPLLPLGQQSQAWALGYGLLGILIACCGTLLWRIRSLLPAGADVSPSSTERAPCPSATDKLWWIALAAVPSGLLVGVTAYITTDLAAAPFLWVVPLALFLLTFVITFQRNPILKHTLILRLHGLGVAAVLMFMFTPLNGLYMPVLHLTAFFISAMVCHGELVRRRPHADHLTQFYLWMSLGGVLGGLFAGLIAPTLFTQVLEYPILLIAVFLVRADTWETFKATDKRVLFALVVLAVAAVGLALDPASFMTQAGRLSIIAVLLVGIVLWNRTPLVQTALISAGLICVIGYDLRQDTVTQMRGFYGVNTILTREEGRFYLLSHGTTIHGAQERIRFVDGRVPQRPDPLVYYHSKGAIASAVDLARAQKGSLPSVAVIGLGSGAMSCMRQPGENWKYFEINPQVVELARNQDYFSFLSECGESRGIVVGDGRLTLADEPDGSFDAIVLDAFSSDSIPVHLLTREAIGLYLSKLAPDGVLVFHITNRYMELSTVVAATAGTHGAETYVSRLDDEAFGTNLSQYRAPSIVAVVARDTAHIETVTRDNRWFPVAAENGTTPWTDDYSNLLGAIIRKVRHGKLPPEAVRH